MPSQSRSQDRYGRDRDRDHSRAQSRRRYHESEEDEEDFEENPRDRRYRRDGYRRARADDRAYDSYDDYDVDAPDDSRRRERASLATSPRKRDRTRDRDDRHRRRRTDDGDASPRPRTHRDRGSRTRDAGRTRDRDLDDEEREEARRHRRREREREREKRSATSKHQSTESSSSAAGLLNADALARLRAQHEEQDRINQRQAEKEAKEEKKRQRKRPAVEGQMRTLEPFPDEVPRGQSKGRIVSGAFLEEGRAPGEVRLRGGGRGTPTEKRWESTSTGAKPPFWKRRKWWLIGAIAVIVAIIIIVVAVVVSKKKSDDSGSGSGSGSSGSSDSSEGDTSNLDGLDRDSIPDSAKNTILDPWTWYETEGFNVTYTSETVGGLSVMGLNSTWDDSARPNDNVPALNKPFPYGSQPIRGVNLGGWLSLEPWITPSLFEGYSDDVLDEYTLSTKLGSNAAHKLEEHYATFITEQDFADIRDAGLDHVRLQFSYWAVNPSEDEPYVAQISWRYLLRAIEWCRKYGLRVNLDPHGIPGSQNGFNHSGRQGSIGWLNGDDGDENAQRSLDFHEKISKFFAQDRYKNVVAIYGLANEPYMLSLDIEKVLNWSTKATEMVQKNGISAWVAFHDGFLNLSKWKSMFKNGPSHMFLDTHQYTIFNTAQIVLNHTAKVNLVCNDWHAMIGEINTTSAGWGPTICGEWSQADTDCAKNLNNVGRGTRWEGTYDSGDSTQYCPTADDGPTCSCAQANADPADYSDDYKTFLQTYAEAQMSAYETAQGWFYWTWQTESAPQWSYKSGWKNGYMPAKAYSPSFKCGDEIPSFGSLAENF